MSAADPEAVQKGRVSAGIALVKRRAPSTKFVRARCAEMATGLALPSWDGLVLLPLLPKMWSKSSVRFFVCWKALEYSFLVIAH
jgi:hypothetical protein